MNDSRPITVEREQQGARGAYVIHLPGAGRRAELTWVERDGIRYANHTFVPGELRGQGIAARLVEAIVADAREQGFRIAPECSYVETAFRRHPEWADVVA